MEGIRVHTSSPINPNAANASAPASSPLSARYTTPTRTSPSRPAAGPATTTTLPATTYASARPGAYPAAAPTGIAALHNPYIPTPTLPAPPTSTSSDPAPPQPGPVPIPTSAGRHPPSIPPPPKAGEVPTPATYYAPQYEQSPAPPLAYPAPAPLPPHQHQANLQTPTRGQPTAAMTSYTTSQDLSHPPGYIQNARASFDERPVDAYTPFGNNNSINQISTTSRSGGILGNGHVGGGGGGAEEAKGYWDTAKSWAKTVGDKLAEGEESIWKAINNREK